MISLSFCSGFGPQFPWGRVNHEGNTVISNFPTRQLHSWQEYLPLLEVTVINSWHSLSPFGGEK